MKNNTMTPNNPQMSHSNASPETRTVVFNSNSNFSQLSPLLFTLESPLNQAQNGNIRLSIQFSLDFANETLVNIQLGQTQQITVTSNAGEGLPAISRNYSLTAASFQNGTLSLSVTGDLSPVPMPNPSCQ